MRLRAESEKGDQTVPLMLYIVMINLLARIGTAAVRKRRQPKPGPMCATCSFAHMQSAVSGKQSVRSPALSPEACGRSLSM
jgi:hypothetical protein